MFGLVFIRRIWDLTANEVADKIGVKRAAVAAWERKKSIPLKRLRSLSELFNGLDEEYFSKELTEIDKLNIQQFKTFKYVNRYIKEKQINTQRNR
jgi:transcriptional regulator with XRE-family HTH domain